MPDHRPGVNTPGDRGIAKVSDQLEPSSRWSVLGKLIHYFRRVTMKNLIAIALLSTAIVGGAASAQQAQPADRAAPTTAPAATSEKMTLKNNWRASKLMGLDVYNEANEKLRHQ